MVHLKPADWSGGDFAGLFFTETGVVDLSACNTPLSQTSQIE
jgi:hypothetical protein